MAGDYTIAHVWSEVELVRQRVNNLIITNAVLTQQAIISVIAGGSEFDKLLEKLRNGG